jgi:hypothetical protein
LVDPNAPGARDARGPAAGALQASGSSAVERIVGEVDLCAFVSSDNRTHLTMDDLRNQALGHSFLRFRARNGAPAWLPPATSFGFWPTANPKMNPVDSYVPGQVQEPDPDETAATGWMTYPLTEPQAKGLFAYKDAHKRADYSIFYFNCTTFAERAIAAAGQAVPDSGALFAGTLPSQVNMGLNALGLVPGVGLVADGFVQNTAMPNNLYAGILKHKLHHDQRAHTTPLGKSLFSGTQETEDKPGSS